MKLHGSAQWSKRRRSGEAVDKHLWARKLLREKRLRYPWRYILIEELDSVSHPDDLGETLLREDKYEAKAVRRQPMLTDKIRRTAMWDLKTPCSLRLVLELGARTTSVCDGDANRSRVLGYPWQAPSCVLLRCRVSTLHTTG